jgi:hypothetical protein
MRLDAIVQAGREAVKRGEVVDGPAALAKLREKYVARLAQG